MIEIIVLTDPELIMERAAVDLASLLQFSMVLPVTCINDE